MTQTFDKDSIAQISRFNRLGSVLGETIYVASTQSFRELPRRLKVGQIVMLTGKDGSQTRGKVSEITGSSLVLLGATLERDRLGQNRETFGTKQTFLEEHVTSIERLDSPRDGAMKRLAIGAISGTVLGLVAGALVAGEGGNAGPFGIFVDTLNMRL